MHKLIAELVDELGSQAEVARTTGLGPQYINQMYNLNQDKWGAKGVSADVIQQLVDRLGLDPMYFFDRWRPGETRTYRGYLTRAVAPGNPEALAKQAHALTQQLQEVTQQLLRSRKDAT